MISKNNQQGDVNAGVVSRFDQGKAISSLRNGTNVNQIRGINVANATGSGIPKHVTNVNTSLANATTGSTTTVTVTFRRDPTDKTFSGVAVLVKGYQGNPSPVQLASGSDSPINFILNNTGEALSLTVQATGNGGAAPLGTAPTVGLSLPKNSAGGTGTTTINSALTLQTNSVNNTNQIKLNLKNGSNVSFASDAAGGVTPTVTIPNLPASQITSGQLALARGGTNADLSATGGTSQVLKQVGVGATVTVAQLAAGDLSNGTTGSGNVVLKTAPSVTGLTSDTEILTAAAPTVAAGQVGLGATTAATANTGAAGAPPTQVVGYLIINVAGTTMKIPYYAN